MIENSGVCPPEGFTMLGVSSKRGDCDAIGQFGSGNKHGINILLRGGIQFRIFCGVNELEFETKPAKMGNHIYNEVWYRFGGGRKNKLSWALEYGSLDWGEEIPMAMREFVSNALDAVGGNAKNVRFAIVDEPAPRKRVTRVFVELTPEVGEFYNRIGERFLHFSTTQKDEEGIIVKDSPSHCRVYRKGVYVNTIKETSLFDYNFGEDVDIDESRNMSEWTIKFAIMRYIAKAPKKVIQTVLQYTKNEIDTLETSIESGSFYLHMRKYIGVWQEAYRELFGEALIMSREQALLAEHATRKGYSLTPLPSGLYDALKENGFPTMLDKLESFNDSGQQVLPPTEVAQATLKRVWGWIVELELTNGKECPPLKCFRQIMQNESETMGYYKDGTVFMNVEYDGNDQTMLEELSHHITGATDNSRDFQDYAFRLATEVCKIVM